MVFGLLTGSIVGFGGFLLSFIDGINISFVGTASLIILTGLLAWFGEQSALPFIIINFVFKFFLNDIEKRMLLFKHPSLPR